MPYLLFYAGMAKDKTGNEQIGLVRSLDGITYEKGLRGGLVLPRDENIPWRNLRTCNPSVLSVPGGSLLMFYQGICCPGGTYADQVGLRTSIGLARSANGVDWDCEDCPILSYKNMRSIVPEARAIETVGLIEPSIIVEGGVFRMWFVYNCHRTHPGNALFHAESNNLREWSIRPHPVLSGSQFGDQDLHYPQVVRNGDELELWFSLRNRSSGAFGIFKAHSQDGFRWDDVRQILPHGVAGQVSLRRRSGFPFLFPRRDGDSTVVALGKRAINKAIRLTFRPFRRMLGRERRALYGYAHPHILTRGDHRVMYFHYVNAEFGEPFLDIGLAELSADDRVVTMRPVFPRSRQPGAWDEFFVGDPFVLVTAE